MHRRDILKFAASLTGSAIIAPLSTSLLSVFDSEAAMGSANKMPSFFKANAFEQLSQIMDVILPKTDTPSASEVNTHWVMDNMFNKVFKHGYKKDFLRKFAQLNAHLNEQHFFAADANKQLEIIQAIETMPNSERGDAYRVYTDIKQQTVSYYLASEEVAEKHLNYLPIPGAYTPCISVKELGGKAWAE